MKNYLLGFLTACTITLMWVLWIHVKATKRWDERTDEYMDYGKYAEAEDEQD